MAQEAASPFSYETQDIQEVALDGVRYALLRHWGQTWRVASLYPAWREEVAALGPNPDQDAIKALEGKGIWLAQQGEVRPLAVMCCGLGSSWPGMGRGLYTDFPAARQALNELAGLADWDILALLAEENQDKINQTRWQIPYLFMLEYAQWTQLSSLGLKPALVCGHSLGELVALCFAGVYGTDAAWHLFDTRAAHMAALEAREANQGGMLAVSADMAEISGILSTWPSLHVSNRNTPRQHILSGPRRDLLEARKSLRKRRVPAFMLNINLAFHNPAMRILRDLSLQRLNSMEMHAPKIPMLSCVTGGLYPNRQNEICDYIIDLDENTVDWTESARAMVNDLGIACFLEIGPQETLCGLMEELEPGSGCLACGRKGHEILAMRQACAKLFALGHLRFQAIAECKNSRVQKAENPAETFFSHAATKQAAPLPAALAAESGKILEIIAEACQMPADQLGLDMDLRYDLALRSSSFPLLVQNAEKSLGRAIDLENILRISTVGDLVRLFSGESPEQGQQKDSGVASAPKASGFLTGAAPLLRFAIAEASAPGETELRPLPLAPCHRGLTLHAGDLVAICVFDAEILPRAWAGLAPLRPRLAVPAPLLGLCAPLARAGAVLIALECDLNPNPVELGEALARLTRSHGPLAGLFLARPACRNQAGTTHQDCIADSDMEPLLAECLPFMRSPGANNADRPWLCVLRRCLVNDQKPVSPLPRQNALLKKTLQFNRHMERVLAGKNLEFRAITWLDAESLQPERNPNEPGDMLALELLHGQSAFPLWAPDPNSQEYCAGSPCFDFVFPDPLKPLAARAGLFQGACHFSHFAWPSLSAHGGSISPFAKTDAPFSGSPWLPAGMAIGAMLESAGLLVPWLSVAGISDVRISALPPLPSGITRECRAVARTKQWLPLDGTMTRLCGMNLACRGISENGRRNDVWEQVCAGVCMLAASPCHDAGLWPRHQPFSENHVPLPQPQLDLFYETLALARPWRILRDFRYLAPEADGPAVPAAPSHEAWLAPVKSSIACGNDWGYKTLSHMLEGIIQGCSLALALDEAADGSLSKAGISGVFSRWRCVAIGYIRFDLGVVEKSGALKLLLRMRRSWRDETMARFDAQICGPDGQSLMTLRSLEFDKITK